MKSFEVMYCFFDSYGNWNPIRIYGNSLEEAMDNARKDAVKSGIKGGLFFKM